MVWRMLGYTVEVMEVKVNGYLMLLVQQVGIKVLRPVKHLILLDTIIHKLEMVVIV